MTCANLVQKQFIQTRQISSRIHSKQGQFPNNVQVPRCFKSFLVEKSGLTVK